MNIETIKSVYFVGAGGIGMSALVRYFLSKGKVVAGYDRTPTPLTENPHRRRRTNTLRRKRPTDSGSLQRQRKHFSRIDPAVPQEHEELVYFRNNGFEIQNARKYWERSLIPAKVCV